MSNLTRWQRWKLKRAQYPANWPEIRREVREAAGNKCEDCGALHKWFHPVTGSVVYIQVAHLDHDVTNCDRANLRALCQRCHLIYDARLHAMNSYATRRLGRAIGDLFAT